LVSTLWAVVLCRDLTAGRRRKAKIQEPFEGVDFGRVGARKGWQYAARLTMVWRCGERGDPTWASRTARG